MTSSFNSNCGIQVEPRKDGLRILVTRFRGRGMASSCYDVWMASLAPSEKLLRDVQSGTLRGSEFSQRYRKQLFEDDLVDRKNRTIKNHGQKFTLRLLQKLASCDTLTLMCHCAEDEQHCHRHLLQAVLNGNV